MQPGTDPIQEDETQSITKSIDCDPRPSQPPIENPKRGADIFIDCLIQRNVKDIFGYPGGAILPVYDALYKRSDDINHITPYSEAVAAHAAEGYARAGNTFGTVIATSGPGALNTVTAVKDAMMDSVPMLVITGQVATHRIGTEAFQEADIVATMRPNAKEVFFIDNPNDIPKIIDDAIKTMMSGRPGPVVIDFPKDMQEASIETPDIPAAHIVHSTPDISEETDKQIYDTAALLSQAERPVIVFGNGVRLSGDSAITIARDIIDGTNIPVVETLQARGTIDTRHPQNLGMGGMHGLYEANMAMQHADVILNVGGRFDDRFIGNPDLYAPHAKIIHIDIAEKSLNNSFFQRKSNIKADAYQALDRLRHHWSELSDDKHTLMTADLGTWHKQINAWQDIDCLGIEQDRDLIHPGQLMAELNKAISSLPDYIITTEVGQHQMWAAQHFDFHHPKQWLTSGGLGTMGYGKPAAMGAMIISPETPTFVICGDASYYMNKDAIASCIDHELPLKMVVLNGHGMGMVQQWQDNNYAGRQSNSQIGKLPGSFAKSFRGDGGDAHVVTTAGHLNDGIERMISAKGAFLLEVNVSEEHCTPMVPAGVSNGDMLLSDQATMRKERKGLSLS